MNGIGMAIPNQTAMLPPGAFGPQIAGPDIRESQGQVSNMLRALEQELFGIENALSILVKRLEPVILSIPSAVDQNKQAQPEQMLCPQATYIREMAKRANIYVMALHEITARVQV